jgi:DNA-binding transcriptional MocR family regulator
MLLSGIALGIAFFAMVLGAVSYRATRVPPQRALVLQLQARLEEVEHDLASLHDRYAKRQRQADMDKARTAHEERARRRDTIEQEAASIIEAAREKPRAPDALPEDPEQARRALRARILRH